MGTAAKRSLYLTTADGLFRAVPEGESYALTCLGFKGQGTFRAPVLIDKDDPRTLYASSTRSGMHKSTDAGSTWREVDHGIAYKEIWSIAQHPKTGRLIAGTCPTDVFISDDGGESWQEASQLQRLPTTKGWTGPVPPHVSRLKWIAVHAEHPELVYGAIEEGWSIRSLDGGTIWEQLDHGTDHDGHSIAIMPRNPQVIVSSGGKGIFRSEDAGTTFVESNDGIGDRRRYTPAPLVQHRSRPDSLVTAIRRDALARLDMHEMTYGWNLEMQMKAARLGLRILELPMPYRCRSAGSSKVAGSLRGTLRAATRIVATFVRVAVSPRGRAAAITGGR